MQGIVATFFEAKKFGFSTPDGSRSSDIFFHISVWPVGSTPKVDMAVEFVTEMDPRSGRLRPSSVRPTRRQRDRRLSRGRRGFFLRRQSESLLYPA